MKHAYQRVTLPIAAAVLGLLLFCAAAALPARAQSGRVAPRVLILVAFQENANGPPTEEAAPWYATEGLRYKVATATGTILRCNTARTMCLLIGGIGKLNALTSLLALGFDDKVDLRRSYIILSGIAGTSPEVATVGSAAWARWIVDYDMAHEIDGRELSPGMKYSRFQQGCFTGGFCGKAGWTAGTEVFELDSRTVRFAYGISRSVALEDPPIFKTYRSAYAQPAARTDPKVMMCDVIGGDTYWVGTLLGQFSAWWMKQWTGGAATYCMTSMEDGAFAMAVKRLTPLGRADYHRFLDLRAASDFDRQHAGQTALQALKAGATAGTFNAAAQNAYLTTRAVARYIVAHWATLQNGVP